VDAHVALALAVTAVAGAGFALNEWTHGAVSEAAGWGHRHLLDDAPWHCGAAAHPHGGAAPHAHAPAPCVATEGPP